MKTILKTDLKLERIHQVLGNFIRNFKMESNYVDKGDPLKEIPVASDFDAFSMFHPPTKNKLVQ